MIEPIVIFSSVAVPCLGVVLVYFYSCCVKARVGRLEEKVELLENVGATAPVIPQAAPVVVRVPYTPPAYQYAPYPPYQQVPPRPSAPPAGPRYV